MKRQLVIVVHGVGVKEAGVSADMLSTALDEKPEDATHETRKSIAGNRLKPHSSDDFYMRELHDYNSGGKRQLFPARIRRYRNNAKDGTLLEERVIADFYWGDISNIASGVAGLFLGILKTILGLCHIVRENALSVFPGSGVNAYLRKVANSAALVIHGPIAAINVVLVLGVLVNVACGRFGNEYFLKELNLSPWLTIVISFVAGISVLRGSEVYLTRWFACWTMIASIVLATIVLVWPSPNDVPQSSLFLLIDQVLQNQVCDAKDMVTNDSCKTAYEGLYAHGLRLVGLMGIAWVWVVLANVGVAAMEIRRYLMGASRETPSLVSATIALMSMLWIILCAAIWATIIKLPAVAIPESIQLQPILGAVGYAISALFCVVTAGILVFLINKRWAASFDLDAYISSTDSGVASAIANRHRIIMSPYMIYAIWVFLLLFALSSIAATLYLSGLLQSRAGVLTPVEDFMHRNFGQVLAALAVGSSLLFAFGQQQLRAGLGIAIDVITWLNDESWNSREHDTKETRIFAERWFPTALKADKGTKNHGYWRRERIKNRLKVMMSKLIRDEQPTEIYFVSHSQGTVVAIDVLNELGRKWLSMLPERAELNLVTMGSPYIHVHRHYFPHAFPAIDAMVNLAPLPKGVLSGWINIFRIDDFVGTHIDPQGQWPQENPVAANGHTYYWIDENVFPILKRFLG